VVLKRSIAAAARSRAFAAVVGLLERADTGRSYLLPVLTYHRVAPFDPRPDLYPGLISATPEEFEAQMLYLSRRFRIMPMEAIVDARSSGQLPRRSLAITFDDAYADFLDHAWPALRRHRIDVTMFIPTAFPGNPERTFWWDRLYRAIASDERTTTDTPLGRLPLADAADRRRAFDAIRAFIKTRPFEEADTIVDSLERPPIEERIGAVMTWTDLRMLATDGVTLASHTRNHAILSQIDEAAIEREVRSSVDDLHRAVGPTLPVFAYPSGGHSAAAAGILTRLGFAAAFTTERGTNDIRSADWMRLRRINVGRRSTLALIRAQLVSRPAGPARRSSR